MDGAVRNHKSKGFARRLAKTLLAIVAAVVIVLATVKYVIGPRMVRQRIADALSESWSGPVRVGTVEFDLDGLATAYGVELLDEQERLWVHVGSAEIRTDGWLAEKIRPRRIDLGGVRVDLHFADGRCSVPFRIAPNDGDETPTPDRVRIDDLTLRIMQAGRPVTATEYAGLVVDISPGADETAFTVTRQTAPAEMLLVEGSYRPADRTLTCAAKVLHAFTVDETTAWFRAVRWQGLAAASGELALEGTFSGSLDEPGAASHDVSLALRDVRIDARNGMIGDGGRLQARLKDGNGELKALRLKTPIGAAVLDDAGFAYDLSRRTFSTGELAGTVDLSDDEPPNRFWREKLAGISGRGRVRLSGSADYLPGREKPLRGNFRLVPEDLTLKRSGTRELVLSNVTWENADLTGDRFEVRGFSAAVCQGTLAGRGMLTDWLTDRPKLDLDVSARKIDLADLARSVDELGDGKVAGKADLTLVAHAASLALADVRGGGKLSIAKGDFWSVPVLGRAFAELGLPHNPAAISDAECVFSLTGPVVNIADAVVANQLAGLECTSGTVNLQTRQVDVVIVGGTFVTINPFSRLLARDIKGKLFGRRVRGKWDQLKPEDFNPLSPEEIPDRAVQVLVGLASLPGQIGGEIIKGLDALFRSVIPKAE